MFARWLIGLTILAVSPSVALSAESRQLRVATFSCDVTPPLGGHPLIWTTPAATIEDPLLAKGIVLDDGQSRYVLCAVDWCGLCNSTHLLFRRKIAEAAGTDVSHVAVQCLHQHTAPYTDGDAQRLLDTTPNPPKYVDFEFLGDLTDRLAAAVRASLAQLQPFDEVGTGEAKVDRVASTRRVFMPDGKVHVRYSACKDPALRDMPEGNIDPMLKTVTLAKSGKPLVRIHYYATHPQTFYGDARVSADMPGFARERLEKKEGVFQIYFTGCAGNVTLGKYNDGSRAARDELIDRLYAGMEASVAATRLAPADRLTWKSLPLVLPARTDGQYSPEGYLKEMADPKKSSASRSVAAARGGYGRRASVPLELAALEIGPASVLCLPGEACVEFQQYAQSLKPGGFVAVAAYGDTGTGYICLERAFAEGGYEPTASRVVRESEGLLKKAISRLLTGN